MSGVDHLNTDLVSDFTMQGPSVAPTRPSRAADQIITARNPYGIALFRPEGSIDRLNWDLAHTTVQEVLAELTGRVLAQCPRARWKGGRLSARAFPLFSYRTFYHLDGDDYDPIVVGVNFAESDAGAIVSGDISGQETGYIYFFDKNCEYFVSGGTGSVVEGAFRVASALAAQDQLVIEAIRTRHPEAMPN